MNGTLHKEKRTCFAGSISGSRSRIFIYNMQHLYCSITLYKLIICYLIYTLYRSKCNIVLSTTYKMVMFTQTN